MLCVALAAVSGDLGENTHYGSREREQLVALLPAGCMLLELWVFMAVPCAQPPGCFMATLFLQPHLRWAKLLRASGGHIGMWWAPELPVEGRGWVMRSGPGVPRDQEAL